MRVLFKLCVAALALLAQAGTWAHDLWLEPATHEMPVGRAVPVVVRIGEHFQGEPVSLGGARYRELFIADERSRRPLQTVRGQEASLRATALVPGPQVLAYWSLPIGLTLPARTFNAYLEEEGLESVLQLREQRGQGQAEAHEAYVRCAKALMHAGSAADGTAVLRDRVLGMPLELVAMDEVNARGGITRFQLLFNGKPLEGALVVAMQQGRSQATQRLRSDAQGMVRFNLQPGGRWLVKAVHMVAADATGAPVGALPSAGGSPPQWLSWWASLTLALPGPSPLSSTG